MFVLDHRLIAAVVFAGQICDLFGGLYLAYDLFGGPRGPLRILTEVITYVVVAVGVGIAGYLVLFYLASSLNFLIVQRLGSVPTLGAALGIGAGGGLGTGLTYALNLYPRNAKREQPRPHWFRLVAGIFVGAETGVIGYLGFVGVVAGPRLLVNFSSGLIFGAIFGVLDGAIFGTLVSRWMLLGGVDPTSKQRPRFDMAGLFVGITTGMVIGLILGLAYFLVFGPNFIVAQLTGLAGGVIAGVGLGFVIATAQRVTWWVDTLPPRRLGILGTILVIVGFAIQASQSFIVMLNVHVQ